MKRLLLILAVVTVFLAATAVLAAPDAAAATRHPRHRRAPYVMLHVINRVTPVRVGAEAEEGLDASMHGESAYVLGV